MFSLEQLNEINFRAWTDPEFLALLRSDTKRALEQVCGQVPDIHFVLVEDTYQQTSFVFSSAHDDSKPVTVDRSETATS